MDVKTKGRANMDPAEQAMKTMQEAFKKAGANPATTIMQEGYV
jgi:hypothetical protein